MIAYVLSVQADLDLDGILDFLERANPTAAERYEDLLFAAFARLATFPLLGHERGGLENRGLRFWAVRPYVIAYLPASAPLEIVAVLHGARDVEDLMAQRFPTT